MAISFRCDCGFKIRAPDTSAGKRGRCPQCKNVVTIPTPEPVAVAADEPFDLADIAVPATAPQAAVADDDGGIPFADAPATYAATTASRAKPAPTAAAPMKAAPARPSPAKSVAPMAALADTPSLGIRRHLYWGLLLVLMPLAWSTLHTPETEGMKLSERFAHTLKLHPEVAEKLEHLSEDSGKHELFDALPDDRLEGALLPERTNAHWAFAAASAVVFLAAAILLFPGGHAKAVHLAGVGLLTGTLGILLLLAFQWLAFHMPLFRGRGAITLLLDLVWLIGQSYRMALGEHGFVLSFLGFTAGVGFCEEACKALPLLIKAKGSGFSSWRSALLWGLVSGIGFGVSEGITYSTDYYNGISGADAYIIRFVSCVGLHGIWAAAVAITIFRRQDHFRFVSSIYDWLWQTLLAVIVPMVLHGLYDTLLKQDYEVWALVVAIASFGWLAFEIERATRQFGEPEAVVAMA